MVNNAWGGYQNNNLRSAPFWEQEMFRWDNMYRVGVRSHLLGSRLAAQMMVPRRQGLIVNTTVIMQDEYPGDGCLFYYAAKHATNRMVSAMAVDLRRHNIPLIGLASGWMRGEASMPGPEDFHKTESPEYSGRAVVAMATDPHIMARSGRVYETADLGQEYEFVDIDGRQLPPFRIRNSWR
jgi:NAD(P)-dependent dehydrogenase (short-subunit alcohol dehydrogenase family)